MYLWRLFLKMLICKKKAKKSRKKVKGKTFPTNLILILNYFCDLEDHNACKYYEKCEYVHIKRCT